MEESKAAIEAVEKKVVEVVSKVIADFQASAEYEDENVELFIDVYDAGR